MGRIAALFDMDKTLLDTSSGPLYAGYLYRRKLIGRRDLATVTWWALLSHIGLLDVNRLIPRMLATAVGEDERQMRQRSAAWFAEDVVAHITERGQERVAEQMAQGHIVAIVSASTQYVVGPLADYLGIPGQYVCTHLQSQNGVLTGEVEAPVCYGTGKVVWAERFAAEHGVDLAASYFYTDSISDLPLLDRVGHPVAVNPDPRLRRLAQKRGWPIEKFY